MHTDLPIGRGAEITWHVGPSARLNWVVASPNSHTRAGGRLAAPITMSFAPMASGDERLQITCKNRRNRPKADGREVYVPRHPSIMQQYLL
jgi:hypothetical protein